MIAGRLVWDNHSCMPTRPHDASFLPQLERLRAAGVDVVSLNLGFGEDTVEDHLRMAASFRHWLSQHADRYCLASGALDIDRAAASGRLAVVFDLEGANAIADQLSLIQLYYDLGVRWMLIAYNRANRAGGGCMDPIDSGLTPFGRAMIAEMERVGMALCLSHTGRRTCLDALAVATRPVLLSHSNAQAVHAHPRNVDDEILRGVAASGGVACATGIGAFLGPGIPDVETLLDHLDHMIACIGPDHVGVGLDYVFDEEEFRSYLRQLDPALDQPALMLSPEAWPAIAAGLERRGHGSATITAVLGGNLRRFAAEVWRSAE